MLTQIITKLNRNHTAFNIRAEEIDNCMDSAAIEMAEILTATASFFPEEWQELIDEKKIDTLYERILTKEINFMLIPEIEKQMENEEVNEQFVGHFIQHLLDKYQTGEAIMAFDEDLQDFFENEKELLTGLNIKIKDLVKTFEIVQRFSLNYLF